MTKDAAGAVFAALADPTRRRVVHELSKDGPLTATEPAPAAKTGVGRETRFELRTGAFAEAEAWMRAIGAMWDQRLAAFKEFVESVPSGSTGRRDR